jgi:hypothetical protein
MLGVSLIITILTQIVSSFLALRGSNLLWGIEVLLKELDPNLDAKLQAAQSSVRELVERHSYRPDDLGFYLFESGRHVAGRARPSSFSGAFPGPGG